MAGIIPPVFPGAMDPKQGARTDRDRARAILKEANLGEVKGALSYASDSTIFGVQMNLLAQKIQADLAAVGITVSLNGLPRATALQLYREGKNQISTWSWAADYPDGQNFLVTRRAGPSGSARAGCRKRVRRPASSPRSRPMPRRSAIRRRAPASTGSSTSGSPRWDRTRPSSSLPCPMRSGPTCRG